LLHKPHHFLIDGKTNSSRLPLKTNIDLQAWFVLEI
jgi:hypothetical protein